MNEIPFNRLLDYLPLEQLSRMNDSDRARLLAEILRQPQSETAWQAILELFATWPNGASKAQHLDIALKALEAWPDKLRFIYSSNGLVYEGNRFSALARLVRSIEIHRREQQGSAELSAIASSEYSAELRWLSIDRSEIDSRAWQAFVQSRNFSNLRHLHVRKTVLGSANIQSLFQSAAFPRLQCLKLIDVGIRPQHLESLGRSLPFPESCALDLSSNALGDEGVTILSRAAWLAQIKRLSLRETYAGGAAIQALLSSRFCERMEELDAAGNRIAETEKQALLALARTRNIRLNL